jgi:hypothetical protein
MKGPYWFAAAPRAWSLGGGVPEAGAAIAFLSDGISRASSIRLWRCDRRPGDDDACLEFSDSRDTFVSRAPGVEDDMGWFGIGVALAIMVGVVVMIARRPTRDLGAVSSNWLSHNRDAL